MIEIPQLRVGDVLILQDRNTLITGLVPATAEETIATGRREVQCGSWRRTYDALQKVNALPAELAPPFFHVPTCRVCDCTIDAPCEGGCRWVPDPRKEGDICSTHFDAARDMQERWIVLCPEWMDGQPVRILARPHWTDKDGTQVAVRYQDVTAQQRAVNVVVDGGFLVLPIGGGR
ncbi:hypothetical protein [Microtetraspora malaysiensis]|uniref:Uncharacterized protein n=1 Tax=Microtetraspora malaysiensis TaxID=161358 RepID=A0ABW6SK87_9ACTN